MLFLHTTSYNLSYNLYLLFLFSLDPCYVFRSVYHFYISFFFFSSRRRHTRLQGDWSSDVCSSDLAASAGPGERRRALRRCALRQRRLPSVLRIWQRTWLPAFRA